LATSSGLSGLELEGDEGEAEAVRNNLQSEWMRLEPPSNG